jgi:hypothetical protein
VNNNYNSNTVVKQDFAVVEQVDGRVITGKQLQRTTYGGGGRCSPKKIFPEKNFK